METLRLGSSYHMMMELHSLLQELNLNPGSEYEVFNEQMEAAVKEFQQQQNITVDGIVGPQTWEKLIEAISFLDKNELKITATENAEVYFNRGVIFTNNYDYYKALGNFSRAIQLDPNFVAAYYERGLLYTYVFFERQKAIEDFTQAIQCDSNFAAAYLERGALRYQEEDKQGAIDDWTEVIRIAPNNSEAYYCRGITREELGDSQGAIEDYIQVFQVCRGVCEDDVKEVIQEDLQPTELESDLALVYYRGVARYYGENSKYREDYSILLSELFSEIPSSTDNLSLAIELDSSFAPAYYYRGRVQNSAGDFTQAADDFTQAIELNPEFACAYYYRGLVQINENQQGAIEDFTQAIELNPDFALAYYQRGLLYSKLGNELEAIEDYKQYLRLDPEITEAKLYQVASYLKQKVTENYLQTLQSSPQDADAYIKRGRLRFWLSDKEGAKADFTQAIDISPDYTVSYYDRGMLNCQSMFTIDFQEEEARQDFQSCIEYNPNFAQAYFCLGYVRYYQETWGDEEKDAKNLDPLDPDVFAAVSEYFTQAINKNPNFTDAYYFRGCLRIRDFDEQDFPQEAIEDFQSCIRINPYFYTSTFYVGDFEKYLYLDEHNQKAIAELTEVIRSNPEDANAYLERGITHYKSGEQQAAIADLTDAIRIKADDADAYYCRGLAHYIQKDYTSAIEDFTQAIAIDPLFADLYALRGIAYYDSGNLQQAITNCNQAIWLAPVYANAHFIKACCHNDLGQKAVAQKGFRTAVDLWPIPSLFSEQTGGGSYQTTPSTIRQTDTRQQIAQSTGGGR
ncbi:tetratricopeptide repeat protein [Scytonema sp. PCC 10023]|uniref:tetratricopeptide repeat protein n=1 Tax=Scytonema sp. PCC 10023 TaxID=1680591 RepID=UPI0039C6D6E4